MRKPSRKSLKWFEDRIGKKIYRATKAYCCKVCTGVERAGLIIGSLLHADYIKTAQDEFGFRYIMRKPKKMQYRRKV